jgi:hypothetical protein
MFHDAVGAERHQIIHQVILTRHLSEDLTYESGLLGGFDFAVSEMRGVFVHDSVFLNERCVARFDVVG